MFQQVSQYLEKVPFSAFSFILLLSSVIFKNHLYLSTQNFNLSSEVLVSHISILRILSGDNASTISDVVKLQRDYRARVHWDVCHKVSFGNNSDAIFSAVFIISHTVQILQIIIPAFHLLAGYLNDCSSLNMSGGDCNGRD